MHGIECFILTVKLLLKARNPEEQGCRLAVMLDLSNNQVFISLYRSLSHKCSTNKEFLARLEDVSLHLPCEEWY